MNTSMKPSEVNHIKTSLQRCSAQGLADELGRAKETIDRKIREIQANQRIENISQYASEKKSREKRKLKRMKYKVKRKVKGGM
ncbi:hypothetical protein AKJ37_02635 [candidate division MSBL1 archaeon SCGC-AAA259I09]|uniref:Transposase IS30-like HTH domain-containing protein n=3 Tax=candidate division MSBL1 TaxID=215777 RepID=A0A133UTS8_9EURY|nr:hypothetical protein AKJ62_02585 [candidate division MSBL1 archaeon SCGC-AAA259D14]KXA94294.1 hypothetical protein AKJ36_03110 [candidate division MSBL1 archaeon SCGC-AAA259I07]KXA97628.1 hypothetical protein AKJ37_02635 [candidate division MSBL1 archaeon SCGC-AAA259I09]